jgi:hypothetical protein
MNVKVPLRRVDAGLPEKSTVLSLLHNRAAKQTIAHVKLPDALPTHRLYWRPAGAIQYRPLGEPTPQQSFEFPVTCEQALVFLCVVEWQPAGTGTSLGIFKVDLAATPLITSLDIADMLPQGAWVHRLLRANDAGTCLQAVVALREGSAIRYTICALELSTRTMTELDSLPGVGF